MGSIERMAEEVQRGLDDALPKLRKTVVRTLALAVYWCVRLGRTEAMNCPTPLEKKRSNKPTDPEQGCFKKRYRSLVSRFKRGFRYLMRCLQNDLPLPAFYGVMRN